MQETLHLSSSATATPIPNFPSPISRPKHLHFPSHSKPPSLSPTPIIPKPPTPIIAKHPPLEPPTSITPTPVHELLLYLDSLGVDSLHLLQTHPPLLSTPLPQLKSAVHFLLSLGLNPHHLQRIFPMCPDLLTSPPNSTIIPATTFLLREAHVSPHNLPHVIHRRPRLLTSSVEKQLRPTLYFLQGTIGIDHVSKWAPLLSCSVESKFVPRIEYFQRLGFRYEDTVTMFRKFPAMFCYSIEGNFEPKFDYFVVGMGREMRELVEFPQYFSFSLENRIKPRHGACVERGVCLALPTMLKMSDTRFWERLEVCVGSSAPVRTSPLWCSREDFFGGGEDVS